MSQYVRHFLEENLGAVPAGLSAVYVESPATLGSMLGVTSQSFVTRYLGDRYLGGHIQQTQNHRCAFGIDAVNADAARADGQVLLRFHPPIGFGTANIPSCVSIGARCSGTDSAWTGYFGELRRINSSTMTAAIVEGTAGTDADLVSSVVSIGDGVVYWMRFDFRGINLKLKVWTGELTDEPTAWTLTTTDATITAAGAISIGGKHTDALAGHGGFFNLFFLSVGTGSDSAPAPPKTWQEYLDFLSMQDALRCVLIEIDPLGQDSGGAGITARVCASNYPFVSKPADVNPHICYEEILIEAPKNKRRMNELFRGGSTVTFGDLLLKNEVIVENDAGYAGRLDAWYAWNWDGRPMRQLFGHPTWRRCDFKTQFLGAVQDVYRAGYGRIGFKIRGRDAFMTRPLPTQTFGGSGPNASALVPMCSGQFFNVDITSLLYDAATLTYQVTPAGFNIFQQFENHDVRDSGVSLKQAVRAITAVNTGTDTLTFDAAHGLVVGSEVIFSGTPPAPLLGTGSYVPYYVKTVPAGDQLTLAATPGGATIDITGSTTGATMVGRLYQWSDSLGRVTLLSPPAGRVTFDALGSFAVDARALILTMANQASAFFPFGINFDAYRGSLPAYLVGLWFNAQRQLGDVVDEITQSVGAASCFTREGNFYLVVLDIPGATAAWTVNADDLRNWRSGIRLLPADVERLGYQKNYAIQKDGLVGSVSPANRDLYGKPYSLAGYVPTDTGLDRPGNHLLRRTPAERVTLMGVQASALAESTRSYNLYRKTCGTYVFDTHAWALAAELGDVVSVTHPMDGFAAGRNAIIVGINETDTIHGKTEVEVFCQIDGQWPVVTSAQPFASEVYY